MNESHPPSSDPESKLLEFPELMDSLLDCQSPELPPGLYRLITRFRAHLSSRKKLDQNFRELSMAMAELEDMSNQLRTLDQELANALNVMSRSVRGLASLCLKALRNQELEPDAELKILTEHRDYLESIQSRLDSLNAEKGLLGYPRYKATQALLSGNLLIAESRYGNACHMFEMAQCGSDQDSPYLCPTTREKFRKIAEAAEPIHRINDKIDELITRREEIFRSLPAVTPRIEDLESLGHHMALLSERLVETGEEISKLESEIIGELIRNAEMAWPQGPITAFLGSMEESAGQSPPRGGFRSAGTPRAPEDFDSPGFVLTIDPSLPLNPDHYLNPYEESFSRKAESVMFSRDSIVSYYKNITERIRRTDLASRILCGPDQFPEVYNSGRQVAALLGLPMPDIYLFHREDFYGAEADGLSSPWICLYTENLKELDPLELKFLLAREMAHIRCNHILFRVISRSLISTSELINDNVPIPGLQQLLRIMGKEKIRHFIRSMLHQWLWATEYTADCAGYLALGGNLEACFKTILKSVVRLGSLADHTNLKAWYRQVLSLDQAAGYLERYSMVDQDIPYGQFRIRQLIGYASSQRAKRALQILNSEGRNS